MWADNLLGSIRFWRIPVFIYKYLVKLIVSNILLATRYAIINLNYEINQQATSRSSICLGADMFSVKYAYQNSVSTNKAKAYHNR